MNGKVGAFLKRKDVVFSASRYGIDALGAMAQGLFASLLIGTILSTLGEQLGIAILVTIGGYAKAATGPAMAVAIGYALKTPQLVLFSLIAVGAAANELGGAGGPLAVLVVAILASECGKIVSKERSISLSHRQLRSLLVSCYLWPVRRRSEKQQVLWEMPLCGQQSFSRSVWESSCLFWLV